MSIRDIFRGLVGGTVLLWSAGSIAQTTPTPAPAPVTATPTMTYTPPFRTSSRGSDFVTFDLIEMGNGRGGWRASKLYSGALTFARCSVHLGRARSVKILGYAPGTVGEEDAVRDLVSRFNTCVMSRSMLPIRFVRGAVAEASILRTTTASAFPERARLVDTDRYLALRAGHPAIADNDAVARLQHVTQCQVVLAPGLVRRLFDTRAGTQPETAALDDIYSAVPVCGGAKRPDNIISSLQRALLAEAFYFWMTTGKPLPDA